MNRELVRLNVGGAKYITTKTTLRKYPNSVLGAMFGENITLSTDGDGYYFIDRCGHIFQYILQFLRSGELILPKGFCELELLQAEANFYQIEDLISTIQNHKSEIENVDYVLLFCMAHYQAYSGLDSGTDIKLYKRTRGAGTGSINVLYTQHLLHPQSISESAVRSYLQNDFWVLKKKKSLEIGAALIFLSMRNVNINQVLERHRSTTYTSMDVEIWVRKSRFDFMI